MSPGDVIALSACTPLALYPEGTWVGRRVLDARLVVNHFDVIRLGNTALDEVRHRVQQITLGHRGHKGDPLYRIRRQLLAGHERLDAASFARVLAWLDVGDPDGGVATCYLAKELLRETFIAEQVFAARRHLTVFYEHCYSSGVPELERLARTIARWETPILRWHRSRLTKARRSATGAGADSSRSCGTPKPSRLMFLTNAATEAPT